MENNYATMISKIENGTYSFRDNQEFIGWRNAHVAWKAYNGSVDAALVLYDELIPYWRLTHGWDDRINGWTWNLTNNTDKSRKYTSGTSMIPSRAFLIAILKAYYIDKEASNDRLQEVGPENL